MQVAAPGVNVPAQGRGSKYCVVSGTSPACALTACVAALIKAKYPKLTAAQVRSAITGSSTRPPIVSVPAIWAMKLPRNCAQELERNQIAIIVESKVGTESLVIYDKPTGLRQS